MDGNVSRLDRKTLQSTLYYHPLSLSAIKIIGTNFRDWISSRITVSFDYLPPSIIRQHLTGPDGREQSRVECLKKIVIQIEWNVTVSIRKSSFQKHCAFYVARKFSNLDLDDFRRDFRVEPSPKRGWLAGKSRSVSVREHSRSKRLRWHGLHGKRSEIVILSKFTFNHKLKN